jgi:diphthamide biosynthesis methyltransferase
MFFDMVPNNINVGVGDTFVVTIDVRNVADMFGWQVYVCYNPAVLQVIGVSFTSNYVFSSSVTVSGALSKFDSTEFQPGPIQKVRNDVGWVLAGDCLLGASQPTFYGSGVLCQIEFKAVSPGFSALALLHDFDHTFQTYILTSELNAVTASSASYSNVVVASG